jgi:N-sulfoglucosamine sulfohydrolase
MKILLPLVCWWAAATVGVAANSKPNIIWIVGEDMGPELGCYGESQAVTPHMDKLANQGARFTRCFTHAPVCAPSRSGLITGMYPTTIGTHHMRSKLIAPPPTFTAHLRKAGYFVAWPGKTDFNFDVPADAFDSTADWTGKLPKQPFFAYLNLNDSHESSIRMRDKFERFTARLSPAERHDPAKMQLPPYHPDTPETRRDLANYYDLVTAVDHKVGRVLKFIDEQGIADNTVVFLMGDHGRGLPRSKRWVYDSGIHVPLIVRWPGQVKPGSVREDLVSFIDFAPTVLALASVDVPNQMQGQIFLGPKAAAERNYIFAARDRMDETFDRIRAVRSKDYKYIRNFHPELPYAQRITYAEEMPSLQAWRRAHEAGKLSGPQRVFFAPAKPREELYDIRTDPHEVHNLADDKQHEPILKEFRAALEKWMAETRDLGPTPEAELVKRGLVQDVSEKYADRKQ